MADNGMVLLCRAQATALLRQSLCLTTVIFGEVWHSANLRWAWGLSGKAKHGFGSRSVQVKVSCQIRRNVVLF